ncbi:MAG TPA: BON domain-containing protein [Steroidobacteraceae bacterium]|jgi:osmotically-inducible protein OsmY
MNIRNALVVATLMAACLAFESAACADPSSDDASVTFRVKSKLDANRNTHGLPVSVATHNGVITLSGEVRSAEEKDLVELLARNVGDAAAVRNDLVVRSDAILR